MFSLKDIRRKKNISKVSCFYFFPNLQFEYSHVSFFEWQRRGLVYLLAHRYPKESEKKRRRNFPWDFSRQLGNHSIWRLRKMMCRSYSVNWMYFVDRKKRIIPIGRRKRGKKTFSIAILLVILTIALMIVGYVLKKLPKVYLAVGQNHTLLHWCNLLYWIWGFY